jgi:hypothetical protein
MTNTALIFRLTSWVVVAAVSTLIFFQPVSTDVAKPAFSFDGHWWRKQSTDTKTLALASMVDAAHYGYLGGYMRGFQDAAQMTPNNKSKISNLVTKAGALKFSHPIKSYLFIVDTYYASAKHLEVPLVYIVGCMADHTLQNATCTPYGAQHPLPTPMPGPPTAHR